MASDFAVTWQFISKRTIVFIYTDQTPRRVAIAQCHLDECRGLAEVGAAYVLAVDEEDAVADLQAATC
jgi:hypothetical protein